MLKLAVAFAVGSLLFCPIVAVAAETASRMNGSTTTEFLQGRTNSLFGIDPPGSLLNQEKAKTYSISPFIEFTPINSIERGLSQKGLVPVKLNSSEDPGCNGSSVDDFLKGKCNKLHGFDVRPYERGNGKLPPAWGGEGSAQFVPLSPEAGGHSWHIYGDEGTTTIPPFFENGIYQRVTPNYGMPWKEVPQLTPNERPMFGPSEQKQQEPNPAAK